MLFIGKPKGRSKMISNFPETFLFGRNFSLPKPVSPVTQTPNGHFQNYQTWSSQLGKKSLEMGHRVFVSNFEWNNLTAVFFSHLARTLGMFCGILNQTLVANSHSAFGQLFWFSGKCVFVPKVLNVSCKTHPGRVQWHFSRTRLKCSFTVVKPPLYCTRKWSCNLSCTSALSLLQLPCNGSTGQVPLPEQKFLKEHLVRGVPPESFCSGRGTWPVEPLQGSGSRLKADVQALLIRWPINRSNRFSDFLRLDRLDRFGKIIKSIFPKFWKREFQFFSDFQNFFGCLKFREKYMFSKFPVVVISALVPYSLTSTDMDREILGSKPTIVGRNSHNLDNR